MNRWFLASAGAMLVIGLAFIFWPAGGEVLEAKDPAVIVILDLDGNGLGRWEEFRKSADGMRILPRPDAQVFCQGKGEAVWVFNWLWIEKGREAALRYLDWLAEDDLEADAEGWLKGNGCDTLGAIRGWNEVEAGRLEAEFGKAARTALSLSGGEGLSVFENGKRIE